MNFHPPPPPLFLSPLLSFFFYPSNIEIIFDFSDFIYIITKIHPPFQNPESAPGFFSFFAGFYYEIRAAQERRLQKRLCALKLPGVKTREGLDNVQNNMDTCFHELFLISEVGFDVCQGMLQR